MEIWNLCRSYSIVNKRQAIKMLKQYSKIEILRLEYSGLKLINSNELDCDPKKVLKDSSENIYFTYDLGSTSFIVKEYDDVFIEIRMNS